MNELAERKAAPTRRGSALAVALEPALVGLVLALVLAVGLGLWFYGQAAGKLTAERQTRVAVMETVALADLVVAELAREGEEAEGLQPAVTSAVARLGPGRNARVVRAGGARLLASTFAADAAAGALPRHLTRDEKGLFDLAQELRSAADTNRSEGGYRKDQIATRVEAGHILVTVPYRADGAFAGIVQLEGPLASAAPPRTGLPALALVVVPALVMLALVAVLGAHLPAAAGPARLRSLVLTGVGLALFAGVWLFSSAHLSTALGDSIAADHAAIGAAYAGLKARLPEAGAQADPARWDIDAFERPQGLLTADGGVASAAAAAAVARTLHPFRNALLGNLVLGALVLAFFGLGLAGRLRATLLRYRYAYMYVAPAMIGMLVLVFFPFAYGIALSFTGQTIFNTNLPLTELWVGLANYVDIIANLDVVRHGAGGWAINYQNFYWTLLVTVLWTVSNVSVGVSFGMILALALNTPELKAKAIYRVILILPWAIPNYITALIWKALFHPQFGAINQAIQMFGGAPVAWFDTPFAAFMTGLACNGWLSFPFMMVVILGGLQSIPSDMYEAANLEGATRLQQFWRITLPLLKPTLVPAVVLSVVWTFNMFNVIYLVSGGEPAGANEILITKAYKIAFEEYRYAYSAAYSTVIFLILLAYGTLQTRLTRATEAVNA